MLAEKSDQSLDTVAQILLNINYCDRLILSGGINRRNFNLSQFFAM